MKSRDNAFHSRITSLAVGRGRLFSPNEQHQLKEEQIHPYIHPSIHSFLLLI